MEVSPLIKLLAVAIFSTLIDFSYAQNGATRVKSPKANINLDEMRQPRMKKDWNNPGAYEIVANLSRSSIYKNDTTTLSAYITGYGLIGNCKLFFLSSNPIFSEESLLYGGLNILNSDDEGWFVGYGKEAEQMPEDNFILYNFGGPKSHFWEYPTIFIDFDRLDSMSFSLLSEKKAKNPPFKFDLKTKEDIEPGDYTINLYMTYFNGVEWKISKIGLPIHVNNWFEQNPNLVNGAAITGVAIAFYALVLQSISFFRECKRKNKTPKQNETEGHQTTKPNPKQQKQKRTPEDIRKAKAQRREFTSKWKWKIKSIFLIFYLPRCRDNNHCTV